MHHVSFIFIIIKIVLVNSDTYTVKIGADHHVNLIDKRFLSFTIDPKYLFSTSGKYSSKKCICMASALTPAFIRIAGPSSAALTFHNSSISIEDPRSAEKRAARRQSFSEVRETRRNRLFSDLDDTESMGGSRGQGLSDDLSDVGSSEGPRKPSFIDHLARLEQALRPERDERRRTRIGREGSRFKRNDKLEISHGAWKRFVGWAKDAGFSLVFAVSHEQRVGPVLTLADPSPNVWDPNAALDVLTMAGKANVGDIYWQLGYECKNQTIEEYLNDVETLRVIAETFPAGASGVWKVVGGDVTGCLHGEDQSDFKDYVTLANEMMDAILLNGNSSSVELEQMSERDRLKLLRLLSTSSTPLWLTERRVDDLSELERAADWLTSLGQAARNGFSVHFRELSEDEMYQPTLSFYMALLFKNLVGPRVLHVDSDTAVFAHCTSLRQTRVRGALTVFASNVHEQRARLHVRASAAGDVLQYVLAEDSNGNIVVNGRPMYHEGDLKPVVKRVRPYKTLLLSLPPKSFGFWVLTNTQIEACFDLKYNGTENLDGAIPMSDEPEVKIKYKRSVYKDFEEYHADALVDFCDENEVTDDIHEDLQNSVDDINKNLKKVKELFKNKSQLRTKRQTEDAPKRNIKKIIKYRFKNNNMIPETQMKHRGMIGGLLHTAKHNLTKLLRVRNRLDNIRKIPKIFIKRNKMTKSQTNKPKKQFGKPKENDLMSHENHIKHKVIKHKTKSLEPIKKAENDIILEGNLKGKVRSRRNIEDPVNLSTENEIDASDVDNAKLWKMLRKIHKHLKVLSTEHNEDFGDLEDNDTSAAVSRYINVKNDEVDDTTFIKSTVFNLLKVVSDLNKNLNRFWEGMKLLD